MRKAFNFYKSYYDVYKELNDRQKVQFMDAMLQVQFFEKHINEISFEDKIVNMVWISAKHSIDAQVRGFCRADNVKYDDMFNTPPSTPKGTPGVTPEQEQGQVQGQEEGQGQGQVHPTASANATATLHPKLSNVNLVSKRDTKKNSPRKALLEFSNNFDIDSIQDNHIGIIIAFIQYRDEMFVSSGMDKYGIKSYRSIINFMDEASKYNSIEEAFELMTKKEWASFEMAWVNRK